MKQFRLVLISQNNIHHENQTKTLLITKQIFTITKEVWQKPAAL
jgi:hypothetical protein